MSEQKKKKLEAMYSFFVSLDRNALHGHNLQKTVNGPNARAPQAPKAATGWRRLWSLAEAAEAQMKVPLRSPEPTARVPEELIVLQSSIV